jgi:hypothetical protein
MATSHSRNDDVVVDPSLGYEKRDAHIAPLLQFGFWLAVLLVITLFGMKWTYDHFKTESMGPPASPFVNERVLPPSPRLQANPHQELRDYCADQQKAVNGYGWVDQQSGIVQIPIDRAMDLVLQHGLPARSSSPPPANVPSYSGGPTVNAGTPPVPGAPDVEGPCGYLAPAPASGEAPASEK